MLKYFLKSLSFMQSDTLHCSNNSIKRARYNKRGGKRYKRFKHSNHCKNKEAIYRTNICDYIDQEQLNQILKEHDNKKSCLYPPTPEEYFFSKHNNNFSNYISTPEELFFPKYNKYDPTILVNNAIFKLLMI